MSRIDEMFDGLPPVLTVRHLTEVLGKDKTTIYRWLNKGEIPGVLLDGTTWIIFRDEVRDYLLSKHNQTRPSPAAEATPGRDETAGDDTGEG